MERIWAFPKRKRHTINPSKKKEFLKGKEGRTDARKQHGQPTKPLPSHRTKEEAATAEKNEREID